MPRLKSAIKRVKTSERNREKNSYAKSKIKTLMKKVADAIKLNNAEDAYKFKNEAFSQIDKSSRKSTLHKNNGARKKAKIAGWLKAIEQK